MCHPLVVRMGFALSLGICTLAAADEPPVFDKRPYAEAKKAAEKDKKWFIVKATAVWCAPCKKMDRTTWRDEEVVKWLKKHAVVVALDVDKEEKIAGDLSIDAMPTMIAFKEGKEFDRIVGYQSPEDLLAWLEGIERGEKSIVAVRQRVGNRTDKKVDLKARLDLAEELLRNGNFDEAADEYVWLWNNMLLHDEATYGVRLTFMVAEMQTLARQHPKSKKRFQELRNETGKALKEKQTDPIDLMDWFALNEVVGDQDASVAWYDKVKNQRRYRPLISRAAYMLEKLLIDRDRWADVSALYPDALEELEEQKERCDRLAARRGAPGAAQEVREEIATVHLRMLRDKAGVLYAALLAGGRDEEASKLARRAQEMDDSCAMIEALVSNAISAREARAEQLKWLDGANDQNRAIRELREIVEWALGTQD